MQIVFTIMKSKFYKNICIGDCLAFLLNIIYIITLLFHRNNNVNNLYYVKLNKFRPLTYI